jgi:hypothetical protein
MNAALVFVQLLPVLECIGRDDVCVMPDPGVLGFMLCRFFSFFAHRTVRLSVHTGIRLNR